MFAVLGEIERLLEKELPETKTTYEINKIAEQILENTLKCLNDEYGCIFYEHRVCHVRQHLNIPHTTLENLQAAYTTNQTQEPPMLRYCLTCPHLHTKEK